MVVPIMSRGHTVVPVMSRGRTVVPIMSRGRTVVPVMSHKVYLSLQWHLYTEYTSWKQNNNKQNKTIKNKDGQEGLGWIGNIKHIILHQRLTEPKTKE